MADYLAVNDSIDVFQWENVLTLANKPIDKNTKLPIGPSNLASVAYILKTVAGMWTHVWKLDSRSNFGSGQGRGRLWGSSFKLDALMMDQSNAHELLDTLMNFFAGVSPSDPNEYLLPHNHPSIQAILSKSKFHGQSADDFLEPTSTDDPLAERKVSVEALFRTNGALPVDGGRKRKKVAAAVPTRGGAWVEHHEVAFRQLGEDTGCKLQLVRLLVLVLLSVPFSA